MHQFQPFNLDEIDINPFEKIGKEWALISAGNKNEYNAMTVSWGGMGILWGKKVAFIFIRDSRYTKELIDKGEMFSVSFLSEDYREALNYCGSKSGRDVDKFEGAGLTPAFKLSTPYPDESNFVLICHKLAEVPLTKETFLDTGLDSKWYSEANANDYHTMYIGEIIESMAR